MSTRIFHPGLEGLRGISVLAVLLFHADLGLLPGGFLGVSTFFTLSGFLITGLLVDEYERTGGIRMGAFWGRRLRRLLPASLTALFVIGLLGPLFADGKQEMRLAGDGLSALFYVSNWWLIFTDSAYDDLVGSPSLVQHFWSLSIEEQFYFVYPIVTLGVLRIVGGSRRAYAAVLALPIVASWVGMGWLATTEVATERIYYGTDTRAGELLIGAVLALLVGRYSTSAAGALRPALQAAGLLGLAVTIYGWTAAAVESTELYQGGLAVYTIGTALVISAAVQTGGPVRVLLSLTPVRWLGRISYGAYVYHWPIFLAFDDNLIRFGLTLVLADQSYRVIEEPIRHGRRIVSWRRFVAAPAAIVLVAVVLLRTTPSAPTLPAELSQPPALPDLERPLRIAVVGDSLGRDVGQGLAMWSWRAKQSRVQNLAAPGCGIARGAWPGAMERRRAGCDQGFEKAHARLVAFNPDVVVVVTAGWDLVNRQLPEWESPKGPGDPLFDEWLIDQYDQAADVYTAAGAEVVWLTVPCRAGAPSVEGSPEAEAQKRMNEFILPTLASRREARDISLVDFGAAICPDGRYEKDVHGIEGFRLDATHLSDAGKLWVGRWLTRWIRSGNSDGDGTAGGGDKG